MLELLENLRHLFEGWKDVYSQYVNTGKVPEDVFDQFKESDPSTTNKYLPWMCKQYVAHPGRQRHIMDVAKAFDGLVEKQLLKGGDSDIYQHTLDSATEVTSSKSGEKSKGEVKREQKSESRIITETDDYLIVVPESHAAAKFYGAGTKWCTSGKDPYLWDDYFAQGIVIYTIIDKKHDKKYSVAVYMDNKKECFDAQDRDIKLPEIQKRMGVKFPNGMFKPLTKEGKKGRDKILVDRILASCTKNPDGTYSTDGDVNFIRMKLTEIPVKFKYVGGNFDCKDNELTTLRGAPQKVGDGFYCGQNKLTSLEGAPQEVRDFDCNSNQLTTLDGAPQEVDNFNCNSNKLTTLRGAPQEVSGSFACGDNQLTTLRGAPQKVGDSFYCSKNKLTSFEGAPQEIGGGFTIDNNRLITLEGSPQKVRGSFSCNSNKLTSLKGSPQSVGKFFSCRNNRLTTLRGAPQKVGGNFDCKGNRLTSLEGAPQRVSSFYCSKNKLTSLEGAPQEVRGDFDCDRNPVTEDELKKTVDREYLKKEVKSYWN